MKRIITSILLSLLPLMFLMAQSDRLLGIYLVEHNDVQSTVRFTKDGDGTYRCQVTWVSDQPGPDGIYDYDTKNPDKSKRSVRADRIVLMEGLKYDSDRKVWGNSRIYDPTSGKSFRVELSFKDKNVLIVKGMWGPFSRKIYWTKK